MYPAHELTGWNLSPVARHRLRSPLRNGGTCRSGYDRLSAIRKIPGDKSVTGRSDSGYWEIEILWPFGSRPELSHSEQTPGFFLQHDLQYSGLTDTTSPSRLPVLRHRCDVVQSLYGSLSRLLHCVGRTRYVFCRKGFVCSFHPKQLVRAVQRRMLLAGIHHAPQYGNKDCLALGLERKTRYNSVRHLSGSVAAHSKLL